MKKNTFLPLKVVSSAVLIAFLTTGCIPKQSKLNQTATAPDLSQGKPKTIISSPQAVSQTHPPTKDSSTPKHYANIWDKLAADFALAEEHKEHYQHYVDYYSKRKQYLKRVSKRATPFLHFIVSEIEKRQIPKELALLPVIESAFRTRAQSHMSASGLWQFMPATGDMFGLHQNWWYDGRQDIIKSTQAALDYLHQLHQQNENDWLLALASYNAGLGTVYKAQRKYRKTQSGLKSKQDYQPNFWQIQAFLPKETQTYVPKLLAVSHLVKFAKQYNVALAPIENKPFLTSVSLAKQFSLQQVANKTGLSTESLRELNPGYHRLATPPQGPHHLVLPLAKKALIDTHLTASSDIYRVQWKRHTIQTGESLSVIAHRYNTSSRAIRSLNGLQSSMIRSGKTLLIPIAGADQSIQNNRYAKADQSIQKAIQHQNNTTQTIIHRVKSGDSLWKLAQAYNMRIKDITQLNALTRNKTLQVGQELKVTVPRVGKHIMHTLKAGESLWILAQRYNTTTRDIARLNNISTQEVIQPGMRLKIEVANALSLEEKMHVVQHGDNLWNIAKANQLSVKKLARHNNLSISDYLKPGQVITIPLES